ncbi:hypothetical protein HRG_005152 [Hirsutella rhossiliensis]|uniref:Uncharacterized protein n=1 Tax=Hirsutella rhossiliensis TaxID=111463 RepID=A0A9P8N2M4_9HYPO|nr:uncharacterized protein HRG_05152 [Hirsutella rhossiliensis]KAH0964724.1 hypothetical protein HRG_05152 [Hirsutella rhossiliensis]
MDDSQMPTPNDTPEKASDSLEGSVPASIPTFASFYEPPLWRPSRSVGLSEPAMTSYRMSWSAVSQQVGRGVKSPVNRLRDRLRSHPVHPAIPGAPDDESAQPRGIPVTFSVDDILIADAPEAESRLVYPQFDSVERYYIAEDETVYNGLLREEAKRLHHYVQNPNVPIRFDNRDFFTTGDEAGYNALSALADKILTAISLCILDNECINVRYCKQISNRSKLQKLIQQAQVAAEADNGDEELADSANGHDAAAERRREQVALFDLINYVSGVLARLITQTGTGNFWQATVLCVLVKRVTKIKVLLLDLYPNARIAAQGGESALDSSRDRGSLVATWIDEEEECEEALRIIDADTKDGLTSVDEARVASYCVNQNKFRGGMSSALRSMVMSLRCLKRSGLSNTAYEICGLVYETGFQGFKTLLFQDRDQEFSATSDLDNLNTADSALRILDKTVAQLRELRTGCLLPNAAQPPRVKTFIEWTYKVTDQRGTGETETCRGQDGNPLEKLALEYMDDIITVMVPLATTNPSLVSELNNFRSIMLLSCDNQELVRPFQETNFTAFFRVYTSTMEEDAQPRGVLRLKTAFEAGTFERCRLIDPSGSDGSWRSQSADVDRTRKFERRRRLMESEWVMDERSVIVPCPTYVLTIATVAVVLAAGGLTIGFTVGNRIVGVDPFNIATYTWVLAAFVILVCKSVLVRDWSWSDFLHLRVPCRSVSELEAVTGIRDQMIIAKLLHDESGGGILVTRGPYNSVFLRRSNEGFSIDRPISTTTMLMSGLMPLKVVTPRGQALVCLDSRRGTRLRIVGHQASPEDQYLVCEDVSRLQKLAMEGTSAREKGKCVRLQLLLSKELRWKRVLGVYDAGNVAFV